MPSVTCPTCGEKGPIPAHLVGLRIKCKKCNNSFVVTPPAAKAPASSTATPASAVAAGSAAPARAAKIDTIEVDGLDDTAWSATSFAQAEQDSGHETHVTHNEGSATFTATNDGGGVKEYKLLWQKDKFFAGKFDLGRLEDALNHYAKQGWIVRSMVTPHMAGFSGGPKEELVVLLER